MLLERNDRIVILLAPKSHVRTTKDTKKIFYIPEVCQKLARKKPCAEYRKSGTCPHVLQEAGKALKKRLIEYSEYKDELKVKCDAVGFKLPVMGFSVYFHYPMPKWNPAKRAALVGQMKLTKPDCDNLLKAFMDSLSIVDERVGQVCGIGKFWTDKDYGFIEILINQKPYNPYGVEFIDQEYIKPKKRVFSKANKGSRPVFIKRSRKRKPLKIDPRFLKSDNIR